jgi:hypothetical protein
MKKTLLAALSFCMMALHATPASNTARLLQQTANDIARAQQLLALQENGGLINNARLATIHLMNHDGPLNRTGTLPANIGALQDALIKEPLLKVLSATPFSDARAHLKLSDRARKALKRYMKHVSKLTKDQLLDDEEDKEDEESDNDERKDKKEKKDKVATALKAVEENEAKWDAEEEDDDKGEDADSDDQDDDDAEEAEENKIDDDSDDDDDKEDAKKEEASPTTPSTDEVVAPPAPEPVEEPAPLTPPMDDAMGEPVAEDMDAPAAPPVPTYAPEEEPTPPAAPEDEFPLPPVPEDPATIADDAMASDEPAAPAGDEMTEPVMPEEDDEDAKIEIPTI